jgi:hypothetical protein
MRSVWTILTILAWGLWFGGMVALFLFVSYLFLSDRATAVVAAPRLFFVFERYQLGVAAMAILSAAMWRLGVKRAALTAIFALFALTAAGTVVSAVAVRPSMERLRQQGVSSGPEFHRLHKVSERLYTVQAALLLVAGVMLPWAARTNAPPQTGSSTVPPTAPPV